MFGVEHIHLNIFIWQYKVTCAGTFTWLFPTTTQQDRYPLEKYFGLLCPACFRVNTSQNESTVFLMGKPLGFLFLFVVSSNCFIHTRRPCWQDNYLSYMHTTNLMKLSDLRRTMSLFRRKSNTPRKEEMTPILENDDAPLDGKILFIMGCF